MIGERAPRFARKVQKKATRNNHLRTLHDFVHVDDISANAVSISMARLEMLVSEEKKEIVRNLYTSGIPEDFIAMQVDLEIPVVISILKEAGVYRS